MGRISVAASRERAFVGDRETADGGRRLEDVYQDCLPGAVGNLEELEAVKGRLQLRDANPGSDWSEDP